MYAQWNYTVTYNGNGSNGGTVPLPSTISQWLSTSVSGPGTMTKSTAPSTFNGWNTLANGSGTNYAAGSQYIGPSVTLYAKWTTP